MKVDVIYVAASRRDGRFTRICVSSIRFFYPTVPIRILVGGPLQPGLADELRQYWGAELANFPRLDYGWGFVKLEPLFAPPGEQFLMLDSDTIMTGPVLDLAAELEADLIVDHEVQVPDRGREIYYDPSQATEHGMPMREADFLFNTGQWFGKTGILKREDFAGLIHWDEPRRLVYPIAFKNGDQGVLNYVVNELVRAGRINVARTALMTWPGNGLEGFDVEAVESGRAPARVVHWAGFKKARLLEMPGADLLCFFERTYYARLPAGPARCRCAAAGHVCSAWMEKFRLRARLRWSLVSKVLAQMADP